MESPTGARRVFETKINARRVREVRTSSVIHLHIIQSFSALNNWAKINNYFPMLKGCITDHPANTMITQMV